MAQEPGLLPGWCAMWAVQCQLQTIQMLSVPVFFLAQGTCLRLGTLHLTGLELRLPWGHCSGLQ